MKCFIQSRILLVPVCGRCSERWGMWGGGRGFDVGGRGRREKWLRLQSSEGNTSFVALLALNSAAFPRAVANPIYANPPLGSFLISIQTLVCVEGKSGRYIILAKRWAPSELAAKLLGNAVAHLTWIFWPLHSISCSSELCLSLSALLNIRLNSEERRKIS